MVERRKMSRLGAIRTTVGQWEEVHSLLSAARSAQVHNTDDDDWSTPLYLETAVRMLNEMSKRLGDLFEGSPHARYSRHKVGEGGLDPWKDEKL